MDLALAAHVARRVRHCADSLSLSITFVKPHLSDGECDAYSIRVGRAVGEMGFAVLFPIYEHYQQLAPASKQHAKLESTAKPATDPICEDSQRIAERVRHMCDEVKVELLDIVTTVQKRADPHEAKGFAQRIQTILDFVAEIHVHSPR